jgi:2-amino-4-hydroxy-6-hydroxymethyldihydropteridine diphosphokinase
VIERAIAAIGRLGRVVKRSRPYASPAWPDPADPPFVNAALIFQCALSPSELLAALNGVEAGFGRRRTCSNGPRTLDLDLLDYDGLILSGGAGLPTLPHPRMAERDFVLAPVAEIAPDWSHPTLGLPASALLARLPARAATPIAGPAG